MILMLLNAFGLLFFRWKMFNVVYFEIVHNLVYQFALRKLMRPLVDASCVVISFGVANSGSIALANCLPNSTPHWSKELISQIVP